MNRSALLAELDELTGAGNLGARRFDADVPLEGRVVVLPSAFNPPTLAHARLLDLAAAAVGAKQKAALLTTRNVDKGLHGASLDHRIGMLLELARRTHDLAVLTTNAARFVDQALALTKAFPSAQFDFVAGHDTLVRIFDARYYNDMPAELAPFFARHRLIVANRGEAGIADVAAFVADRAHAFRSQILIAELEPKAASISSTDARSLVASGARPSGLAEPVRSYITRHELYGAPPDTP